jgi:hypothetical protein
MSITTEPGTTFTAILTGAAQGLEATLEFGVRQLPEGTLVVPQQTGGIVEYPQDDGTSNYAATRTMPLDASSDVRYETAWPTDLVDEQEQIVVLGSQLILASQGRILDIEELTARSPTRPPEVNVAAGGRLRRSCSRRATPAACCVPDPPLRRRSAGRHRRPGHEADRAAERLTTATMTFGAIASRWVRVPDARAVARRSRSTASRSPPTPTTSSRRRTRRRRRTSSCSADQRTYSLGALGVIVEVTGRFGFVVRPGGSLPGDHGARRSPDLRAGRRVRRRRPVGRVGKPASTSSRCRRRRARCSTATSCPTDRLALA